MPEVVRMWIEVSFNVTYLVVVWGLVIAIARRQLAVVSDNWPVAS
jgi:hypothetical protein